ncbi:hypothetical protein CYMTET_56860 [Cymbomonas tetramitiformis]|uniref:SWIM-type domain-containing protein n=1 Tax=Cymbomonas tetramitiformis TaxID=36881 RepID=A0AAE0ELW1_9CHLO|nr:hypothetical protein CYMTET_56860 [Cymbomonas tetramitiformis]
MLQEQGHACQVITLTSAQMLKVLVGVESKEFLYEQKSKPAVGQERWDSRKASKYPIIPGSFSEGAHMRINAASILLSTVTLDSDHHVAPLMSYSVLLTNQNEHSHTLRQLNHAKEVYGDAYDCPERREMSDQDKSVNSNLEAMNWANDAVRQEFVSGVHTTAALLTLVKQSARRFYENKRKAHAARGPVPSAVVRKLEAVVEKAGTINSGISFVSRSDKSIARVESTTRPGVAYTSKLITIATCDCGVPDQSGLPCHHNLTHARFAGLDCTHFVDPRKTVTGWQAQYPAELVFPDIPNLAEAHVHELYNPRLKLPPAAPRRKPLPEASEAQARCARETWAQEDLHLFKVQARWTPRFKMPTYCLIGTL